MSNQQSHPSHLQLTAYSRGQLDETETAVVEEHISECEPCCDTVVSLSSDDTLVGLLQEAGQLSVNESATTAGRTDSPVIPSALVEHPRYEILGLIGQGGMGDVYRARHRMMDRSVAIKVINRSLVQRPEAVDRFHREVKAAAQLAHPNIVTAYDAEKAGDVHLLVMELVDGTDLSEVVKQRGPLSIEDACDYVCQAAQGLSHAASRGMVHRDIKPHNLMVMKDGTVKVLDFGLASLAPDAPAEGNTVSNRGDLTSAGAVMGTPDFISPEQARDARQADIRSDIYSLGSTLYFLLSGSPPFSDGSVTQKIKSHAYSEPEALTVLRPDIPEALVSIVNRMTAKDPNDRIQTPQEVATLLRPFSGKSATDSSQLSSDENHADKGPSHTRSWIRAAGLILAVVVLGVVGTNMLLVTNKDKAKSSYDVLNSLLRSQRNIGFIEDPLQLRNAMAPLVRDLLLTGADGEVFLHQLDQDHDSIVFDRATGYCMYVVGNKIYLASKDRGSSFDGLEFYTSHIASIHKADNSLQINLVLADSQRARDVCEKLGLDYHPAISLQIDFETLLGSPTNVRTVLKDGTATVRAAPRDSWKLQPELVQLLEKSGVSKAEFEQKFLNAISRDAGIPLATWQKLWRAAANDFGEVLEGEPLSVLLLLRAPAPGGFTGFRMLSRDLPGPEELQRAMSLSEEHGYVSVIQPEFVKHVTMGIDADSGLLQGSISFEAAGLYSGEVDFALRYDAGKLKTVEFALPFDNIKTVLDENDRWRPVEVDTEPRDHEVTHKGTSGPKPGKEVPELTVIKSYYGVCSMKPADPENPVGAMTSFPIYSQSDFEEFIRRIPRKSPGIQNPKSTNKDPLLSLPKIDFEKNMVLVLMTPDTLSAMPEIKSVREDKDTVWVRYQQPEKPSGEKCPAGMGAYTVVVVPWSGEIKHMRFSNSGW